MAARFQPASNSARACLVSRPAQDGDVPTYEADERFEQDYRRLRPDQRAQFRQALREFIGVLRDWEEQQRSGIPQFPAHLGVKPMVSQRTVIMELRWAPDGRCTWEYGRPRQRRFHVVWRRIGTHSIYDDP